MAVIKEITHQCKNCENEFTGKFCNKCGEKVIDPKEKNISFFVSQFVFALFNFDNKLFRTIKVLFSQPGQLTHEFIRGRRKPFIKPQSLFLLITVVYFIVKPFQLFITPLNIHESHQHYGEFATSQVKNVLMEKGISHEELSLLFIAKSEIVAKWLILLFIPTIAILLFLLYFKRERFLVDHLILSLELNSYNILAHFLMLPAIVYVIIIVSRITSDSDFSFNDDFFIPFTGISLLIFFTIACKRIYQNSWVISTIKSGILIWILSLFSFSVYRFILFWIVMKML